MSQANNIPGVEPVNIHQLLDSSPYPLALCDQAGKILQIFDAYEISTQLLQFQRRLASVPETGHRTPSKPEIFHGTIPSAALLRS